VPRCSRWSFDVPDSLSERPALRRVLPLSLAVLALCLAGAASAATPRILLVGDSWVAQAWASRVFQTALISKGLGDFEEKGDVTAIGGTTAAQWATAPYLQLITDELVANPEIDIVHLSIGGNDFLGAPAGTDILVLAAQILADTQTVVDHILAIRPQARVVHSSYDYIPAGYNTEQGLLLQLLINQAAATPGSFVLNNLGVLHHVFGYPGQFLPGETPLPGGYPGYVPLQGGDPAFVGHPDNFVDQIHPNTTGYLALADHAIDEFYMPWLAPPVPVLGLPGLAALAMVLGVSGRRRLAR
jgi:lysophospholipase L1-like esterase